MGWLPTVSPPMLRVAIQGGKGGANAELVVGVEGGGLPLCCT